MRIQRIFIPLLIAAGATFAAAAPASANPYPPAPPVLTTSSGSIAPGGGVTLNGASFTPFELISIDVTYTSIAAGAMMEDFTITTVKRQLPTAFVKDTTAGADGTFSTVVTLTQAGRATITAHGETSGVTATAIVTVGSGGSSALPTTGTAIVAIAGSGLAALLIGAALIWLTRSRRRRTYAPAA